MQLTDIRVSHKAAEILLRGTVMYLMVNITNTITIKTTTWHYEIIHIANHKMMGSKMVYQSGF